jgi:hypothetical protein
VNGRRVGAVVLAIALVVGAFVVRRNVIEDDDSASTDGTEVDEPDRDDATALYCITELAEVCDSLASSHDDLDVTIEDAGETLDRLAALGDDETAPLWLTIDPFPAMVDALRQNAAPLGFETQAVGASQLAVAYRAGDKSAAIAEFCEGDSTSLWRCLGEQAGQNWSTLGTSTITGTLRPSLGDVSNSALGLTSFGSAIASYFGAVDVDRTQFDDTSFIGWLRRLSRVSVDSTQVGSTPLATLAVRPAPDAAATAMFEVNALETPTDESSPETSTDGATGDRFDVNYSEPQMWIQAVIATPAGVAAADGLATDITNAVEDAGWDPATAAEEPVPSASTLLALRQLWNDYTT